MKLPSWRGSIWSWACGGLIVASGLILLVVVYWDGLQRSRAAWSLDLRPSGILSSGLGFGGIIAIGLAAWRGIVADCQAKASDNQAETSRAALLHDRYQRGAEMLGHQLPSVRWSGILSLQHLAEDEREQHCVPVITLLGYVSEQSTHTRYDG